MRSDASTVAAGRPRRATLLMLSGGIDSTYLLYKLLTETDDEIIAHHVHLINAEERAAIEDERCRAIVAWCRCNIRGFRYSETAIDHRGLPFYGFDVIAAGFEAGLVARSYLYETDRRVDRWTLGFCTDERDDIPSGRMAHIEACVAANSFPEAPPPFWHRPIVSKREEMAALPKDLLALTWSCRRPRWADHGPEACGACRACRLMARIERGEYGALPDDDEADGTRPVEPA